MHDDPSVAALVTRATGSDQRAWDELVERCAPLIWSICFRYGLSGRDIEDVGQTVWLLAVGQLGKLREPAAMPGWLATTTRRECMRALRAVRTHGRVWAAPDDMLFAADGVMIEQAVIEAGRHAALRAASAELPPRHQRLLTGRGRCGGAHQQPGGEPRA